MADRVGPVMVPALPAGELSTAEVPEASSKPYAPTSPVEAVLFTVTVTVVDVLVLPLASRATAVSA